MAVHQYMRVGTGLAKIERFTPSYQRRMERNATFRNIVTICEQDS